MKKRGFTMVELMIVVAVIAVLASIIIPKMKGARDLAALNACEQNLLKIEQAAEMYANDNNGVYCPAGCAVNDSCYLVTGNYMKTVKCPLGNRYVITPNYTGWEAPSGRAITLIYCNNYGGGVPHPGIRQDMPSCFPGGGIQAWKI